MINKKNSITSITHKLSKYVDRLAYSSASKSHLYTEKVQQYIDELAEYGIQSGGTGEEFARLQNQHEQIKELIKKIRDSSGTGDHTKGLESQLDTMAEQLGNLTKNYREAVSDRKTLSDEFVQIVGEATSGAITAHRALRDLSKQKPDLKNALNLVGTATTQISDALTSSPMEPMPDTDKAILDAVASHYDEIGSFDTTANPPDSDEYKAFVEHMSGENALLGSVKDKLKANLLTKFSGKEQLINDIFA